MLGIGWRVATAEWPHQNAHFFDTEFNGFREHSQLLSIGLVSEDGRACYAELPTTGPHLNGADDFVFANVLTQFQRVPGAGASDRHSMGERVAAYLRSFEGPLLLCYDYKLDWRHLEALVGAERELLARMRACDIAGEGSTDQVAAAARAREECAEFGVNEHHALFDAYALRAAWLAR